MRDDLANLVYPVITTGLRLREQVRAGTAPPFDVGRAAVVEALRPILRLNPIPNRPQAVEAPTGPFDLLAGESGGASEMAPMEPYLGIGYALTCWADELFITDSAWRTQWNELKLEVEFFRTNDRAWRFWIQAGLAALREKDDDLETFFLCVALGFRGDRIEEPEALRTWVASTRERLMKGLRREWVGPPEREVPTAVPPRNGLARLRRMALIGGVVFLLALPFAALLIARQIGP